MRVWLITIGEPLPIDGGQPRLLRAGLLAEKLVERGHDVLWWSSAFNHISKIHRAPSDMRFCLRKGLDIQLLHGPGYRRNLSLARIHDHRVLARKFASLAPKEPKPDVVLASFPPIELCLEATRYGYSWKVPVVLDVRDLWPDIFLDYIPAALGLPGKIILAPLFRKTLEAFRGAFAVTGITAPFVQWGLERAKRERDELDRDFPMGYPSRLPDCASLQEARLWWRERYGVGERDSLLVVFFGNFGRQIDMATVLETARRLNGKGIDFVLCGEGERLEYFKQLAAGLGNVFFPGWVDAPRIRALMDIADIGLAPYFSRSDFLASYPNKVLEYLSGGLPVLSSIGGLVGELIESENCGLVYQGDNQSERLAVLLNELLCNRQRLRVMSDNARHVFESRFSAEIVYEGMVSYLERVAVLGRGN